MTHSLRFLYLALILSLFKIFVGLLFFTSIFHRIFSIWEGFWNSFWRRKFEVDFHCIWRGLGGAQGGFWDVLGGVWYPKGLLEASGLKSCNNLALSGVSLLLQS